MSLGCASGRTLSSKAPRPKSLPASFPSSTVSGRPSCQVVEILSTRPPKEILNPKSRGTSCGRRLPQLVEDLGALPEVDGVLAGAAHHVPWLIFGLRGQGARALGNVSPRVHKCTKMLFGASSSSRTRGMIKPKPFSAFHSRTSRESAVLAAVKLKPKSRHCTSNLTSPKIRCPWRTLPSIFLSGSPSGFSFSGGRGAGAISTFAKAKARQLDGPRPTD